MSELPAKREGDWFYSPRRTWDEFIVAKQSEKCFGLPFALSLADAGVIVAQVDSVEIFAWLDSFSKAHGIDKDAIGDELLSRDVKRVGVHVDTGTAFNYGDVVRELAAHIIAGLWPLKEEKAGEAGK